MTEAERAWAAGIFEGEGCFALHGGRRARALLAMTDRDVVERFARVMGYGTLRTKVDNNPQHRPQWLWAANSRSEFERTVELFSPWLGERRLAKANEILTELRRTDYITYTCLHCGKTERILRATTNSAKQYCSRNCKHLAYQKRNPGKRAAYQRLWRLRTNAKNAAAVEKQVG